ncbi:MAG: DEAD/DEAH box helicase [Desulfosoma sp.]|uniref:DEAD/DEAH box helicase n=1 Tax=Desulfosoma sp. TaxID=2603217 RepID=UPI0040491401
MERLAALRAEGVNRAAVVAATGLSKTHLAAFDFKHSGFQRVLFIAHRENPLRHAREIFAQVFGDKDFGGIFVGGHHADRPMNAAFAMIQTLSRPEHLEQFPRDHFEYVVVDEFHHAAAKSYERVVSYFQPRFLSGLTATPERSDGHDVLALCGYNIASEIRLLDAVDRGWLTPFQYYASYDPTDYEQIIWRGAHYDEGELEQALCNDTRMGILVHNLSIYLPYSGKIKALAFCSSIAHAKYAARVLSDTYGIPSAFLVGKHAADERQSLIARLQNEEAPLQVIRCVDVFNEGIDIPERSHVLLLRPTQSFSLFLQQIACGLRRAENKDFVVVIDFVGNYRKAQVAPLALMGYGLWTSGAPGEGSTLKSSLWNSEVFCNFICKTGRCSLTTMSLPGRRIPTSTRIGACDRTF